VQQQQPRVSSQHTADQAMADGDSLKRSSDSQAALSLLFSLDSGDIAEVSGRLLPWSVGPTLSIFTPLLTQCACLQKLGGSVLDGLHEYDPVTEVQRIKATVAALSEPECKVGTCSGCSSCCVMAEGSRRLPQSCCRIHQGCCVSCWSPEHLL